MTTTTRGWVLSEELLPKMVKFRRSTKTPPEIKAFPFSDILPFTSWYVTAPLTGWLSEIELEVQEA